ncbi:MAG TPA: transporter substrate-binding domain-containing protein [Thermoanaerobaculia bacterium]|jgi:polar amino acid transport system substrate-binding protein|nr:transporter substrate-binding domain-containing protein [Thermoanaerobaculia bacterium]
MQRTLAVLLLGLAASAALPASPPPLEVLAYDTPHFFFHQDGKPAGLEFEILQYYAKAKGQTLHVIWVDKFETMLDRLRHGEGEVAAGTFTITPERQQVVSFSAPYMPVRVMLIEPRSRTTHALADLRGATLATIKGTTYEQLLSAVPDAKLVYGITEDDLLRLVAGGKARAAAADSAIVLGVLTGYPTLKLGIPLTREQGLGFAVSKGSPLAADLSKHIQQLKSGQIYYRLLEKYFGAEAARLVAAGKTP